MHKNVAFDDRRYKIQVWKSIFGIALFVVVYLLFIALGAGLLVATSYGGYQLLVRSHNYLAFFIGLGLIGSGLLFFFLLIQFIFKSNRQDRSLLVEVTAEDEPELHAMIARIAGRVGTSLPRHVFLSGDVNAGVFEDATFWNMFLPMRKNLSIGLGLVRSVRLAELEAILAHEFGHFSQRSLRLGVFIYHVNRIIHSIVLDPDQSHAAIQEKAKSWALLEAISNVAFWLLGGTRKVLYWVYGIVNVSYMGLSREMEFHADRVAAGIAGAAPLVAALKRMALADFAYGMTINFYQKRYAEKTVTFNLFSQTKLAMEFIASNDGIPLEEGLPEISLQYLGRFNRSKVVINRQWESHPSMEDRIDALEDQGNAGDGQDARLATELFKQLPKWELELTNRLFAQAKFEGPVTIFSDQDFDREMRKEHETFTHDPIYHDYYDTKQPTELDIEAAIQNLPDQIVPLSELFNPALTEELNVANAMASDLEMIRQIADPATGLKTFDYDGKRYRRRECDALIQELEPQCDALIAKIQALDRAIFQQGYLRAIATFEADEFKRRYIDFFAWITKLQADKQTVAEFQKAGEFMQHQYDLGAIILHHDMLRAKERPYRNIWEEMLQDPAWTDLINDPHREEVAQYLEQDAPYFANGTYQEDAIQRVARTVDYLMEAHYKFQMKLKKELMAYQANILKSNP